MTKATGTYGPPAHLPVGPRSPYWNQCKFTYSGTTYQCYTGCPANFGLDGALLLEVSHRARWTTAQLTHATLELSYWNSVSYHLSRTAVGDLRLGQHA